MLNQIWMARSHLFIRRHLKKCKELYINYYKICILINKYLFWHS